jgi:spermidine synthase
MARSPRWLLPLLAVLFFGSGACALVYQVMWLRLLALVFGVTVYAASTVLAGFMAGLGVGSFVGGRLATRFARPLVAFGIAEALVGITAFATPFVLEALTRVWVSVHADLPDSLFALTVIRFIVAFLVLIVPTSMMGATLPLIIKSAVAREARVGGKIGLLYAINTTGAIVGALVAGFYFISEIGVANSFKIAAAANVAIGVIAILASFSAGSGSDPDLPTMEPARTQPLEPLEPLEPVAPRLVLWVFFVKPVPSVQ